MRDTSPATIRKIYPGLRRMSVGKVAELVVSGREALEVKNAIHGCYVDIGKVVKRLTKWKKAHGYCQVGLSCMNKSSHNACARCKKRVKRESFAYTTPYGKIRKSERLEARRDASRA